MYNLYQRVSKIQDGHQKVQLILSVEVHSTLLSASNTNEFNSTLINNSSDVAAIDPLNSSSIITSWDLTVSELIVHKGKQLKKFVNAPYQSCSLIIDCKCTPSSI